MSTDRNSLPFTDPNAGITSKLKKPQEQGLANELCSPSHRTRAQLDIILIVRFQ